MGLQPFTFTGEPSDDVQCDDGGAGLELGSINAVPVVLEGVCGGLSSYVIFGTTSGCACSFGGCRFVERMGGWHTGSLGS